MKREREITDERRRHIGASLVCSNFWAADFGFLGKQEDSGIMEKMGVTCLAHGNKKEKASWVVFCGLGNGGNKTWA